jgi:hypothetical protein
MTGDKGAGAPFPGTFQAMKVSSAIPVLTLGNLKYHHHL